MAIRSHRQEPAPPLPEMPATVITADGQEYNVAGDVWLLPEVPGRAAIVRLDWRRLTNVVVEGGSTPVMSARGVSLVKLYIAERLCAVERALKPRSTPSPLLAILHLVRWLAASPEWLPVDRHFEWSDLTAEMFDAWLTVEYRTKRKGHSATLVRQFYMWGAKTDAYHHDFSSAIASVLYSRPLRSCLKNHNGLSLRSIKRVMAM